MQFLILFFNYSLYSILFYFNFMCTAQQSDNHILYNVIPPPILTFPPGTIHSITILLTIIPMLCIFFLVESYYRCCSYYFTMYHIYSSRSVCSESSHSFLLMLTVYSTARMCHDLFKSSPSVKYLGCLHFVT